MIQQKIIVEAVRESIWLRLFLVLLPVIVTFTLTYIFKRRRKKDV